MEAKSLACPSCGGIMEYDAISHQMKCPYCGSTMPVDELESHYNQVNQEYQQNETTAEEFKQAEGAFKSYRCSGCGAEVLTDENTTATFCSFCGNPTLIEDRLTGVMMPKYVIPFRCDKNKATEDYLNWAKKGLLTPSMLKSNATIEKITGMYVPFWLYDYSSVTDVMAHCTKVRSYTSGEYRVTETRHFEVARKMTNEFERIPVDASIKMDDTTMDLLEPFHYQEMQDFKMPYLSGFYSEKYDFDSNQMIPRIEKRVANYAMEETLKTIVGYSSVKPHYQNVALNRLKSDYALLPVWMLNYKYNNKDYTFVMNGQTGKIVAQRPISVTKSIVLSTVTFVVTLGVLLLLGGLFG